MMIRLSLVGSLFSFAHYIHLYVREKRISFIAPSTHFLSLAENASCCARGRCNLELISSFMRFLQEDTGGQAIEYVQ
ncbi:hypothetical protein F5146DRAFT_518158 [Armillaria mellea]|nr:hypothetical protein F5146DRAFT_518158 [Armillaria mellea]